MFDKRIARLCPQAFKLALASVAARWVAFAGRVCTLFACACMVAPLCGDASEFALYAQDHGAYALALALLGCLVFGAASVLAQRLSSRAAASAKRRVRSDLYRKLFEMGECGCSSVSSAEAAQLLGEGVERLDAYMGRYLPQLFFSVLAPLTLFFLILPISPAVALTLLACVPLIPVSIALFMKAAKRVMGAYWDSYVNLAEEFLDAVRGLTTLISYRADETAHERLNERAEQVRQATMRLLRVQLNSVTLMDFFAYGGAAAGICVALVQLAAGSLAIWQFIAIVFLSLEFFLPMRTLGSYFHTGMGAAAVIDRAFAVLDAPIAPHGTQELAQGDPDLVVRDLCYSYGEGEFALSEVNIEVPSGSYVGITGLSGSGKSTLVDILAGRLTGYAGSVRLGGVEVRDLAPHAIRQTVCVIGARSHVFRGTVRSNLRLGRENATDAQMWEALRRCKLQAEVLELGGLDAEVAEGGSNLSGGQRQRLCIARALLRDAPIYVFDEATSAVDAKSEADILALIQQLALTKTIIVVSHRLAALRWTDEVYLLDAGRVAQQGEHAYLLHAQGAYERLWAQQVELEQFAQAAQAGSVRADQKVMAGPEISPGEARALEQMPESLAAIMYMAIENKPVREAISGAPVESGHPSWIPRGPEDTRPEKGKADSRGANQENAESSTAPTEVSHESSSAPTAAPHRGSFAVVTGLLKVTRAQLGVLVRAVCFGVCALLMAVGAPACALAFGLGKWEAGIGSSLTVGCMLVIACGFLRGPLRYAERLGTHDQAFRTLALVRNRVFGAMRKLAPAKLQGRDAGDLVSLLTSDVELLEGFYARAIAPLVVTYIGALLCLVALALIDPSLVAPAALFVLLAGVVAPLVGNRLVAKDGKLIHDQAVFMTALLLDSVAGMEELLQFGGAARRADQMDEHLDAMGSDEGHFALKSALASTLGPLSALVALALIAYGTSVSGAAWGMSSALLLAVLIALMEPLCNVAALGSGLHQVLAAGSRILDVLGEDPQTPEVCAGQRLQGFEGARLHNVSFAYPDGTEALVSADMAFEPGRICALTGRSGAGKSTVLKLLMRFWDPSSGAVSINGYDLRTVNTADVRRHVGYAQQDTYLFNATLRDNICMACPEASQDELTEALHRAALEDLVERLPQGLDTPLGSGGARVSDGERQRIGLARLFLYGADLNLLDEPTSNLDVMHEAAVLRSLHESRDGRAYVIVSHRPSAASIAHTVYRMGGD